MSSVGRLNLQNIEARARIAQMGSARLHQTVTAASATMRGIDVAYLSKIAASVIGTAAVAAAAKSLAEKVITAGSAREGEELSRRIAGITAKEGREITVAGGIISDKHRSITRTDAEAMLRDARTIVGSTEGALAIGDTLAQLRVVLQRLDPGGDINKQLNDFTRVADLSGATGDSESFKRFANSYAKVQGAFPGVINPLELSEYAKKSHGAAMKYSPEFSAGVVPSLIQSSGGATTGEMLASFQRNIVDERLDKQAKKKLATYGLMKGGHIIQRDLAASDPYLWTREVLVPALERKGVKDVGKQSQIAGSLFSDMTAAEVTKRFVEQSENIERDRKKAREAMDLSQAREIEKSDLGTALTSMSAQATNAGSILGSQFVPSIIYASKKMAEFWANTTKQIEVRPQFGPELGESAVLGGPRNPIAPFKDDWARFVENSRGQISKPPISSDIPESVLSKESLTGFNDVKNAWHARIGDAKSAWRELDTRVLQLIGRPGQDGKIKAEAELKGSAEITQRLVIEPSPLFDAKIDQRIDARGALRRGDVGTTMEE
ncbi:MAG: hypothetical protein AB7U61_04590 [Methylocystis sp.]